MFADVMDKEEKNAEAKLKMEEQKKAKEEFRSPDQSEIRPNRLDQDKLNDLENKLRSDGSDL